MRWVFALVAGLGSIIGGVLLRRGVYLDPQALANWGAGELVWSAVLGWGLMIGGICLVTLAVSHAMSAPMLPGREPPASSVVDVGPTRFDRVPRARVVRR